MPLNFMSVLGRNFYRICIKRCFLIYEETWQNVELYMIAYSRVFTYYLTKELYDWKEAHLSVITLLMANIVSTILIPQNYIDFHRWKKRTCTKKRLSNLIQTIRITNGISNKTYGSTESKEFKNCDLGPIYTITNT